MLTSTGQTTSSHFLPRNKRCTTYYLMIIWYDLVICICTFYSIWYLPVVLNLLNCKSDVLETLNKMNKYKLSSEGTVFFKCCSLGLCFSTFLLEERVIFSLSFFSLSSAKLYYAPNRDPKPWSWFLIPCLSFFLSSLLQILSYFLILSVFIYLPL